MSRASIQQDIIELKELETELKRKRKEIRALNQAKKGCEQRILEYLEHNEQPGVRYQGVTLIAQDRAKRRPTRKQEKYERAMSYLRSLGISADQSMIDDLMESIRGDREYHPSLRFM
jgi:hypothetical protein